MPREVCRVERTAYEDYSSDYRSDYRGRGQRVSRTPPIVGAILGGAIGNAVGRGKKNRRIGTAVGAILGGSIGADIARSGGSRNSRDDYSRSGQYGQGQYGQGQYGSPRQVSYRNQQVCHVEEDYRSEQQLVGYQVTYAYAGQTYRTTLPQDPGPYLDIHVQVTPAGL